MTNNLKLIFVSLILAFSLTNCASNYKTVTRGKDVPAVQDTSNIAIGKTTKEDVMVSFGAPYKISHDRRTFFYRWPHGTPLVQITGLGKTNVQAHSLEVIFDDFGVVKNYTVSNKIEH